MEKISINSFGKIEQFQQNKNTNSSEISFADTLKDSIMEINDSQQNADMAIEQVLTGELGIHEGMLKIQEADISLRLLLQVKRKVMDAYTEIMRMQL